jgi:hypothetical protein
MNVWYKLTMTGFLGEKKMMITCKRDFAAIMMTPVISLLCSTVQSTALLWTLVTMELELL